MWCEIFVQKEWPKLSSNRQSDSECWGISKWDSERDRDIKGRSPDSHTQKSVSRKCGAVEGMYKLQQKEERGNRLAKSREWKDRWKNITGGRSCVKVDAWGHGLEEHRLHSWIAHFVLPQAHLGFLGGSVVKDLPAIPEPQKTWVQFLGWEDPLKECMAHTPVFRHGQGSLVGYSPWDKSRTWLSDLHLAQAHLVLAWQTYDLLPFKS